MRDQLGDAYQVELSQWFELLGMSEPPRLDLPREGGVTVTEPGGITYPLSAWADGYRLTRGRAWLLDIALRPWDGRIRGTLPQASTRPESEQKPGSGAAQAISHRERPRRCFPLIHVPRQQTDLAGCQIRPTDEWHCTSAAACASSSPPGFPQNSRPHPSSGSG
jgi:hypothetical protein